MRNKKRWTSLAAIVVSAAIVAPASADLSDVIFSVSVEADGMTGSWQATQAMGVWDGDIFSWSLTEDQDIMDSTGTVVLGTLGANATSVYIERDPILGLNFNVTSGAMGATFTITAPLLTFPGINNAQGRASAGISVTDVGGNGASLAGNFMNGNKSYRADTNGLVPGGNLFRMLVDNASTPNAFDTVTSSEAHPGVGFENIPGVVSSMHSEFRFTLGASDNAAGTSVFVIIPTPATCSLLAFAGLTACRRRRR